MVEYEKIEEGSSSKSPRCKYCGNMVTKQFAAVFGDSVSVEGCPSCCKDVEELEKRVLEDTGSDSDGSETQIFSGDTCSRDQPVECGFCGELFSEDDPVPNPGGQPVHRSCFVERYGGPEWLLEDEGSS